jgi:hypothetical protein
MLSAPNPAGLAVAMRHACYSPVPSEGVGMRDAVKGAAHVVTGTGAGRQGQDMTQVGTSSACLPSHDGRLCATLVREQDSVRKEGRVRLLGSRVGAA